jgi:acyl-CoA thioester hydrolase
LVYSETAEKYVETVGRPHSHRSLRAVYPRSTAVTLRYADLDPNGHVNNVALESMHENARAQLTHAVFPAAHQPDNRRTRFVNSQNVVHFLAEAHWPASVDAAIGVGRIGRTSFILSSALFHQDRCLSVCDAVLVSVAERPVPLSADIRARLEQLQLLVQRTPLR